MDHPKIIALYFVALTIITYSLFRFDKGQAKNKRYRTPEKTLLLFCFFGGSIGGLLGMYIGANHKSKKWKFKLGVPLMFILHISIIYYLYTLQLI